MEVTRIVIVEDEPLFRELLVKAISADSSIQVVGVAEDGEKGIRLAEELQPDVMLMDIELKGELDGIEAASYIKKENQRIGVVILSMHNDQRYVSSLPFDKSPGWAYLLKQTVPDLDTVMRAIAACKNGMVMLDPALVRSLRPRKDSALSRLSKRQRDVLELIAQGYNNAAIAKQLTLSERSVETYINIIYQELGLSNEPDIHARVKATLSYLQNVRHKN